MELTQHIQHIQTQNTPNILQIIPSLLYSNPNIPQSTSKKPQSTLKIPQSTPKIPLINPNIHQNTLKYIIFQSNPNIYNINENTSNLPQSSLNAL